jgi:hypothetical protein
MIRAPTSIISFFTIMALIATIGIASADTGVQAVPEIQGISTATSSSVVGTVTETDSGAWTLTNDPSMFDFTVLPNEVMTPFLTDQEYAQLKAAGGSATVTEVLTGGVWISGLTIPNALMNQPVIDFPAQTWGDAMESWVGLGALSEVEKGGGIHTGVLDPEQVQYTTGYNSQYSGVSGQQTFAKTVALSTANTIADKSNIKANTDIQFIAVDTGRATNSEDLLLDGAAQVQNSSGLILCPFANANPGIIPAFCNIVQAGSGFDTTLTSTVTSADTRFVGADATIPVVLNYQIKAQGITLGNQSSPMIGSVSSYLKVHVQEARNESSISGIEPPEQLVIGPYSYPDAVDPVKSEDLVYSESSTANGLINQFSKSMSYTSQSSAVPAPPMVLPVVET